MPQKEPKHCRKWCEEQGARIARWKPWTKAGRKQPKRVMDDYQALANSLMGIGKAKA